MIAALLFSAHAASLNVELGIAPAKLHNVSVEIGAPPRTVSFTSGVPLTATLVAGSRSDGAWVEVELVVAGTKVERSLSRKQRAVVASTVRGRDVLAKPLLVVNGSPGSQALYQVGGELPDGEFYGVLVRIDVPDE